MARQHRPLSASEKRVRLTLATNIKRALKKRTWSVVVLAKKADVSKSLVYDLINMERAATVDILARLAKPLHMEAWELIRPRR